MKKYFIAIFFIAQIIFAQSSKTKFNAFTLNREVGYFSNAISISGNSFGEIFILDSEMLYKFSTSGELIDSVGGSGWSELNFSGARDVSANFPLSVFVTEEINRRVQKIDKNFSAATEINYKNFSTDNYSDFDPIATTTIKQGDIFVLEKNIPSLLKLNSSEIFVKEIVGENFYSQLFQNPKDIVSLSDDKIAVLDKNFIFIFDWSGVLISKIKIPQDAVTISAYFDGTLLTLNNEIFAFTKSGEKIFSINSKNIFGVKEELSFRDVYFNGEKFFLLTEKKLLILEPTYFKD